MNIDKIYFASTGVLFTPWGTVHPNAPMREHAAYVQRKLRTPLEESFKAVLQALWECGHIEIKREP